MVVVSTYGKVHEIVNNKPQLQERRKTPSISYKSIFESFTFISNTNRAYDPESSWNKWLDAEIVQQVKNDETNIQPMKTRRKKATTHFDARTSIEQSQIDYNCHERPLLFYLWSFLRTLVRPNKKRLLLISFRFVSFEISLSAQSGQFQSSIELMAHQILTIAALFLGWKIIYFVRWI